MSESIARTMLRASPFGGTTGAMLGALESSNLLVQGAPRYGDWALGTVALGVAGYGILGVLLATACAPIAWVCCRKSPHLAAPPSTCAALGAMLGLIAFIATDKIGASLILPASISGTLACVALREWIARARFVRSELTYLAILLLALAIGGVTYAIRGGRNAAEASAQAATPTEKRPDVVLITIDTLRSDHLGCYGKESAQTPNIDALAKESVLFLDTTSQSNTTGPSHTSMLTGLYPAGHGALQNGVRISPRTHTLPEMLADSGYQTAAFVSGFTLKDEACGLAARFQRYDDELIAWNWMPEVAARLRIFRVAIQIANGHGPRVLRADRPAQEPVDAALSWIDARVPEQPYFLWVHCYDPHAPYAPPAQYARLHDPDYSSDARANWYTLTTRERRALVGDERELAKMRALYAGEISYTDAQVGRLFDHLRAKGLFDRTLVIVTSDHGEGLGEHGYYFDHGSFLYDSELHVPLVMHLPDGTGAGVRVGAQTRLIDLAPTVLEAVQLRSPEGWNGSSLLPLLHGADATAERPSFGHGELSGELSGYDLDGRTLSLRAKRHKLIWTSEYWLDSLRVPERIELYDLEHDPHESRDLWPSHKPGDALSDEMLQRLDAWRTASAPVYLRRADKPDAEVLEQLRNIGYF